MRGLMPNQPLGLDSEASAATGGFALWYQGFANQHVVLSMALWSAWSVSGLLRLYVVAKGLLNAPSSFSAPLLCAAEAKGVVSKRLQNLVVTLDKVKSLLHN